MLLEALRAKGLVEKVTVVDQSVTVGMQSIEQNKIAAHSTWEPYPSLIESKGIGKLLISGEETSIDYLTGVVANKDWAEKNHDYVTAFLQALNEAHTFIANHPNEAADIFQQESKYPIEVCKKMVQNIRFDAAFYEKDKERLPGSAQFLASIGKLKKSIDIETFLDDSYLRDALQKLDRPYLTGLQLQGDWIEGQVY